MMCLKADNSNMMITLIGKRYVVMIGFNVIEFINDQDQFINDSGAKWTPIEYPDDTVIHIPYNLIEKLG